MLWLQCSSCSTSSNFGPTSVTFDIFEFLLRGKNLMKTAGKSRSIFGKRKVESVCVGRESERESERERQRVREWDWETESHCSGHAYHAISCCRHSTDLPTIYSLHKLFWACGELFLYVPKFVTRKFVSSELTLQENTHRNKKKTKTKKTSFACDYFAQRFQVLKY